LHALKLDIERRMKAAAVNFEKYEQARFMLRADYNKVVLEGVCWGGLRQANLCRNRFARL